MVKYIRTKEGIFEVSYVFDYCYLTKSNLEIKRNADDKQADTIEELCDEFVYCHDIITEDYVKEILENKEYICKEIYGAIWTDKGLIYVAKVNDKGELELL